MVGEYICLGQEVTADRDPGAELTRIIRTGGVHFAGVLRS